MADQMLRVAGRGEDGNAKAIRTTNAGALKVAGANVSVAVEYTLPAGSGPASYNFITTKIEGSKGNAIKISGYKYIDVFVIAETAHVFGLSTSMYQRFLADSGVVAYQGGSADLGLHQTVFADFVRDYKLQSAGGVAAYIKEMRVFGNYFNINLSPNGSLVEQKYLMVVNLYN